MAGSEEIIRKITNDEEDQLDRLRDTDGNQYEISEAYFKQAIKRLQPSADKEIELGLAKELLRSNLDRLTLKQKDVMYYTMMRWDQERIAAKMNISKRAVAQHLALATKKLARIITGTKEILKEGLKHGKDKS